MTDRRGAVRLTGMATGGNEQLMFDWDAVPPRPGPLPAVAELADRLRKLADRGVHLGTSSWKYPGWQDLVYNPARYHNRAGRFSHRRFNDECLTEYAEVFPTVCGDFAFYQFPADQQWKQLFRQVPRGFRFSLKVPEEITTDRYPNLARYARRAGQANAHFLDPAMVRDQLLDRLEPYRDKLGVLIFQFPMFKAGPLNDVRAFVRRLQEMFARLPVDRFQFAVEVRNATFLETGARDLYLGLLHDFQVAHVLNSWTHMPPVIEQLRIPGILTAPHVTARFLLRPGRAYQQAVDAFAPYDRIRDPYPQGRDALRELIETCLPSARTLYAFVNNRFEGNSVITIDEVTKGRKPDPASP